MSIISVVAKLVVKEGAVELVKTELLKLIMPTRKEEGCIEYRLHQDNTDPSVFIFYENWQNIACLERHINSAHYKSYVAAVGDQLAEKVVYKLTEIG
jgi:quinol monooxygenase YgiN